MFPKIADTYLFYFCFCVQKQTNKQTQAQSCHRYAAFCKFHCDVELVWELSEGILKQTKPNWHALKQKQLGSEVTQSLFNKYHFVTLDKFKQKL